MSTNVECDLDGLEAAFCRSYAISPSSGVRADLEAAARLVLDGSEEKIMRDDPIIGYVAGFFDEGSRIRHDYLNTAEGYSFGRTGRELYDAQKQIGKAS